MSKPSKALFKNADTIVVSLQWANKKNLLPITKLEDSGITKDKKEKGRFHFWAFYRQTLEERGEEFFTLTRRYAMVVGTIENEQPIIAKTLFRGDPDSVDFDDLQRQFKKSHG